MDVDARPKVEKATRDIEGDCYNPIHYLSRASVFQNLGYPDLASGDAYKALLLIDEILDDSGEYHERAKSAFDEFESRIVDLRNLVYEVLITSLLDCKCLRSAYKFAKQWETLDGRPESYKPTSMEILESCNASKDFNINELLDSTMVRREIYPWNTLEPDRNSAAYVATMNDQLKLVAPKCEARVVTLPVLTGESGSIKQLGLVARSEIEPGEVVLNESSLLAVHNSLHDTLCDACSSELPLLGEEIQSFSCPDCDDIIFCSQKCLDDAMEAYHPAVCGMDIESIARDPDPKEAGDALYFLLLGRTIAMAETQHIHPLELKEISSLWGDFMPVPLQAQDAKPSLPFSFTYNIVYPLHLLEKMDLDIYATTSNYDFWILNTLYAKFRGVASARPNLKTGAPEVCAVHPLWCLANHSCAPNVTWEWSGNIKLVARKENQIVQWGSEKGKEEQWPKGIKAGEEILNHYCDIELDVKQRREWAQGPLGGNCMCERCLWEAEHVLPDLMASHRLEDNTVH